MQIYGVLPSFTGAFTAFLLLFFRPKDNYTFPFMNGTRERGRFSCEQLLTARETGMPWACRLKPFLLHETEEHNARDRDNYPPLSDTPVPNSGSGTYRTSCHTRLHEGERKEGRRDPDQDLLPFLSRSERPDREIPVIPETMSWKISGIPIT
jgi:hypothetical protein